LTVEDQLGYYPSTASNLKIEKVLSGTGGNIQAPQNVRATPGDGKITISWDSVAGGTYYKIFYSTTQGNRNFVIMPVSSPYEHTGLTNGTTYYYSIYVSGSDGNAESVEVSATPTSGGGGTKPSAPTQVSAKAGNGTVTISWGSVSGATSYNLYWSTSSGVTTSNGTKVSAGNSMSYSHTGRTNGTTYYYVVTALNSYGESNSSSQVSAKPTSGGTSGQRFSRDSNGIITDSQTGLQWKDAPHVMYTWVGAQTYVTSLGSNWRMATIDELKTLYIADSTRMGDTGAPLHLDPVFQNDDSYESWSGDAKDSSSYWTYEFSSGTTGWGTKNSELWTQHILAVRP